ncbi:hypothetical protein [Vibrio viridaestus]|uniref:Uncharacterized protein n=1 Tax=Vibrio viridaestus TaxID=2487322 RepID=A0A3N9TKC0_9VIBR|nr:hypothetical protein [Vibrio viridaestus]RQW64015.1 hypothetical protein EES38_05260 [Vibrio viridaestus]
MDMPTPCQNCGELHDLSDLQETVERNLMVCDDCFEELTDKCDECGEVIKHHYDRNKVDDGTPEGKTLCFDCFCDLGDEDEEE